MWQNILRKAQKAASDDKVGGDYLIFLAQKGNTI
jgi:hypothetical protein